MAVIVVLALLLVTPTTAMAVSYDGPQATVYTINVDESGDATWTIELRYQLTSEEDIEAFEGIVEEFEAGNITFFDGVEEDMAPLAEEASNETGREMSLSGFERDARVEDTVTRTAGIASLEFNWSNFAEVEDGKVRVGDVFVGSGLVIADDERLVIRYEGEYEFESIVPQPDINTGERLIWDGERFFEERQPEVVLANGTEDEGNGTTNGGETDDGDDETDILSSATTVLAGLLVLMSGFAGGVYLSRKTEMGNGEEIAIDESEKEETEIETQEETEILTDKDRVERLLRDNGGRMKQANIVDETDWSKSKVSMMLSDMEDEGRISKLRLGRENVIDLEDGEDDEEEEVE